ncbi:hypothetical protein BJG93_35460 [Paraburkholderia sprentiae WSM5005]|uniref:Uncharacterized protein n=1 Tax=Paraburkholderia sprentiae WSM5005 TaxID=754502 RepID=A0A8F4QIM4_9BURK|nr:hypothetical protein [Paraburkholderia sprentiae]QXE07144.1 hypothetical protein BJG93_35460 [Paraburkholderia sprentiae WSM5005]
MATPRLPTATFDAGGIDMTETVARKQRKGSSDDRKRSYDDLMEFSILSQLFA